MIKKILLTIGMTMPLIGFAEGNLSLEKKIGQMLMLGFHGTSAPKDSQICTDIQKYN